MLYRSETGDFILAAAGDSLITRRLAVYDEPRFTKLFDLVRGADAAFTNLEMLFHDFEAYPAADAGGTWMRADAAILDELLWAGFTLFGLANNHTLDYGIDGLITTMREIRSRRMVCAGTGANLAEARAPAYLETKAGRVAVLAASSSFALSARAGEQRPDMPGRPGLSCLRHTLTYQVPSDAFRMLERLAGDLGLPSQKQLLAESGMGRIEAEGVLSFSGLRFIEGPCAKVITEPLEEDLNDICRWIREARRQADWVIFGLHAHERGNDRHVPAQFIERACRSIVDAGADVVVGHGPHVLRGIEVHNGRPIFYSLGNFIYQGETVFKLPADYYDKMNLGHDATPADAFDARSAGGKRGRPADPVYWEALLPIVTFTGGCLASIAVHPVVLGFGKPRSMRGRPVLAEGQAASDIIAKVDRFSRPYGVSLAEKDSVGVVRWTQ